MYTAHFHFNNFLFIIVWGFVHFIQGYNLALVRFQLPTAGFHQENMSVYCIPPKPYTPLLYSKTGVHRGIPIFLIFALKRRLWVLVRTASAMF